MRHHLILRCAVACPLVLTYGNTCVTEARFVMGLISRVMMSLRLVYVVSSMVAMVSTDLAALA